MNGARKLRVLHLNLAETGGVARYGLLYGRALADRPDVACFNVWNRAVESTVEFWPPWVPENGLSVSLRGAAQRANGLMTVLRAVARFRPDVIHDTAGSAMWLGALLWPWLARQAPLFITEHDPVPHERTGWRTHEKVARALVRRLATTIIVHGRRSASDLKGLGVPANRIHIEAHGTFRDLLNMTAALPRERDTVLFFGSMRPNKGIDWLPAIADKVRERVPTARFVVAGAPGLSPTLQKTTWPQQLQYLLNEFRTRSDFELHEQFIPDSDVVQYFSRAAVTLLPYRDATQSGVAMLAFPAGSAVVATSVGNLPDLIQHEHTGILCSPEVETIAAAVSDLLSDPSKARRIAKAAQQFANTVCSWPSIAARTITVYGRAIMKGAQS